MGVLDSNVEMNLQMSEGGAGQPSVYIMLLYTRVFLDGPQTFLTPGPWGHPSFLFMSFHMATQLCSTTSASIPQGRQGAKLLLVSCIHKQL